MTPLESALRLAGHGMAVFPVHSVMQSGTDLYCTCGKADCKSPGKHPLVKEWQSAASTFPNIIKSMWRRWPYANVGVVTGARSKVVVLDIDPKAGGEESLDTLVAKHGRLPDAPTVMTGGGGMHVYFRHPGNLVRNSASAIAPGLDIRGDGGFTVGPGSKHVSGGEYGWEASSDPAQVAFPVLPEWLMKLVLVRASVDRDIRLASAIAEGGRNAFLTSLAGAMRRYGCGRKVIETALLAANDERCSPPLESDEVALIAKSVSRYSPAESIRGVA